MTDDIDISRELVERDTYDVIDKVVAKRRELGAEGFAAYTVLLLSILAGQSPETVTFLMDRADRRLIGKTR